MIKSRAAGQRERREFPGRFCSASLESGGRLPEFAETGGCLRRNTREIKSRVLVCHTIKGLVRLLHNINGLVQVCH